MLASMYATKSSQDHRCLPLNKGTVACDYAKEISSECQ